MCKCAYEYVVVVIMCVKVAATGCLCVRMNRCSRTALWPGCNWIVQTVVFCMYLMGHFVLF